MKNAFIIALCFLLALLSWILFDIFSINDFRNKTNIDGTYVDMDNMGNMSKSDAVQKVLEAAESNNVIIIKRDITYYFESKDQNRLVDATLYTTDCQTVTDIIMQNGITAVENRPSNIQGIILDTFDKRYSVSVYPLNSPLNNTINGEYIVVGTNSDGFINQLAKHHIVCNIQKEGYSYNSNVLLVFKNKLIIFFICFIMIMFWGLIILSINLKLISVKRLLGYGRVRITSDRL